MSRVRAYLPHVGLVGFIVLGLLLVSGMRSCHPPIDAVLPPRTQLAAVVGSWDDFRTPLPLSAGLPTDGMTDEITDGGLSRIGRSVRRSVRRPVKGGAAEKGSKLWVARESLPCGSHLYRYVADGRHLLAHGQPISYEPSPRGFDGPSFALGKLPFTRLPRELWRRLWGGAPLAAFHSVLVQGPWCGRE